MSTPPTLAPTPAASVGLQCPYCQTALAAADPSATCGDCAACHHEDCWTENQGCAVPGCESAPDPLAATTTMAAVGAAGASASDPVPAMSARLSIPVDQPPGRGGGPAPSSGRPLQLQARRKHRRGPIVVGVLLALLVIGAVVGLLASSGADEYTVADNVKCSAEPTKSRAQPASCINQSIAGEPHSLSGPALIAATQRVVREYYGALVKGGDAGREQAKQLLSNDEQTIISESTAEDQRWEREAVLIQQNLENPQSARVVFEDPVGQPLNGLESSRKNGIARVKVVGMRWEGRSCNGRFEGQTWLRFETTPQGTVAWRLEPVAREPRRVDALTSALPLLGAACLGR